MPNQKTDAEAALQKLGQRIRAGWSKLHPIAEQSLDTVRTTEQVSVLTIDTFDHCC